jgi:hypothetical protein
LRNSADDSWILLTDASPFDSRTLKVKDPMPGILLALASDVISSLAVQGKMVV